MHHKYSETDADPHNSNRGFFFAHVGWLLCRKHPEVKAKGKNIIMDDLLRDPIVRFQKKYVPMLKSVKGQSLSVDFSSSLSLFFLMIINGLI